MKVEIETLETDVARRQPQFKFLAEQVVLCGLISTSVIYGTVTERKCSGLQNRRPEGHRRFKSYPYLQFLAS